MEDTVRELEVRIENLEDELRLCREKADEWVDRFIRQKTALGEILEWVKYVMYGVKTLDTGRLMHIRERCEVALR